MVVPPHLPERTIRKAAPAGHLVELREWDRLCLAMEGLRYFGDLDLKSIVKWDGDLPHWDVAGAPMFLTYRLADSLPADTANRLRSDRRRRCVRSDLEQTHREYGKHIRDVDEHLHAGYGTCLLKRSSVAKIVARTLHYFDGVRYDLHAWCIMPNHVHVVAVFRETGMLPRCLKCWKGYAARQVNQLLGREGRLFQREYFDHLIRNGRRYDSIMAYVQRNPRAAGLSNWPWVWQRGDPLLIESAHCSEAIERVGSAS